MATHLPHSGPHPTLRRLLLALTLLLTLPHPSHAADGDTFTYNGVNYVVLSEADKTCATKSGSKYTGGSEYTGDLVLSENVPYNGQTYKLTSILEYSFVETQITSVSIPNSVTHIGRYAFYSCDNLKSVTVPCRSIEIEGHAFERNNNLTNATLSDAVLAQGLYKIDYKKSLRKVIVTDESTSIPDNAFSGYYNITSVSIPDGIVSIGENAFSDCSKLTGIAIPTSVETIGANAFSGCSNLTEVHIADLAAWCDIKFATYDTNPLYNAHHLYLNGSEIKELVIPESATSIAKYAFSGCTGLTSIVIPQSVIEVEANAFSGCN